MARLTRSTLARYRQAAGFTTAREAAKAVACSRVYLLEIEEGRSSPSPALLERMAKAYGKSTDRLRRAVRGARADLLRRQLAQLKMT